MLTPLGFRRLRGNDGFSFVSRAISMKLANERPTKGMLPPLAIVDRSLVGQPLSSFSHIISK